MRRALLLAVLLTTGLSGSAQVKRTTTTTRPRTTTTTRPHTTTTARPAQQKPTEKRWGCYDYGIRQMAIADSVIYLLEDEENNAVLAMDCQTGELTTVIPGYKGVYEGKRPEIKDIAYVGGKLVMEVMTKDYTHSVRVWDGQSVSTSKKLANAQSFIRSGGKYLLVFYESREYPYENFVLWDMEEMKALKRFPSDNGYEVMEKGQIDANGTTWCFDNGGSGLYRVGRDGKSNFYKLFNEPYFQALKENGEFVTSEADLNAPQLTVQGDYAYVACLRRIFRMNVNEPGTWEEYAKIPPTQPYRFKKLGVMPDGSFVAMVGGDYDNTLQFYEVGKFDSPTDLGKHPSLPDGWTTAELWVDYSRMYNDAQGNLVILDDWAEGAGGRRDQCQLWILNPRGIQGYKNVVGKVVKQKN